MNRQYSRPRASLLCAAMLVAAASAATAQPPPSPAPQDTVARDSLAIPVTDSARSTDTASAAADLEWLRYAPPNSADETYLRYLQIAGSVSPYPWSLRGFSNRELRRLATTAGTHPWSGGGRFTNRSARTHFIPFVGQLQHNTAFPYGSNDGAVWAGRGVTASATVGIAADLGPLSLALAPIGFVTQNLSFDILPTGFTDRLRFADGLWPTSVDRPQRFGDGAYGRFDPGNSGAQLTAGPFAVGIGTSGQAWGPMERYPFVLGTNAPGFLHGFAGTARPLDLRVARAHGRLIWGLLEQSEYSPVSGSSRFVSVDEPGTRRFASGLVAILEPHGLDGLELGVARFIHSHIPRSGIPAGYLRKPLFGLFKSGLARPGAAEGEGLDNQLVSLFARWAFPAARLELYGEYGRDDHSWDRRDFAQEPDHARSYGLGIRHVAHLSATRLDGITFELINFQLPTLARTGRGEGLIYLHRIVRQGHTHRGQLLGADVGVDAAAGLTLRWDRYVRTGRRSLAVHRTVRQERGSFYLDGNADLNASDVQYAAEAERTWRAGASEITTGLTILRGLNRDFQRDVWGASAVVTARVPLSRRR